MLKVTFPHIGTAYIPIRALLIELGLEPVIPPPVSQKTISLGTKLAPEFACFPLKVNLGNFMEAFAAGADAILMGGGVGPCRFGYYGEVQREILKEAGYEPEFLVLEAPKTHPRDLWEKVRRYFPKHRFPDLSKAIRLAWLKAETLDRFDRMVNRVRPLAEQPGRVNSLQDRFYQRLDQTFSVLEIKELFKGTNAELQAIPIRPVPVNPLKLVLVGEIFMVLEPRVNFQIERLLGELGVEVERTIYLSDWIKEQLFFSIFNPGWRRKMQALARPYLQNFVGGHGLETVAHTVAAGINRYDGVIQLAPFTCMPEIVAMQALPTVARELAIPVLTIIIDEHAAEAGVRTRLEAFCDLLGYRKQKRAGGRDFAVISGR